MSRSAGESILRPRVRGHPAAWIVRLVASVCLALLSVAATGQTGPGPGAQPGPLPAGRAAKNLAIITIKGEIDEWTAFSVSRRIAQAEREGADGLLFEIDTPGGELGAVRTICNAIKGSQVQNTVAWVHSDAYSGGAIIGLACREIIVAGNATFGDALPIQVTQWGQFQSMTDSEREKFLGPLLAEVVDSARRNGYDEYLVQSMVRTGIELWLVQDPATGKQYFVTEAEAEAALGHPPVDRTPTIGSYTGPVGSTGPRPAQVGPPDGEAGRPPPAESDPTAFRSAGGPLPSKVVDFINTELEEGATRSSRPDFWAPEHAGKYQEVEYVADGHQVLLLKAPEMIRYGLAVREVSTQAEVEAFFGAQNVVRLDETWSEGLARILTIFWVRGLLVVLFLVCLFIEMANPGMMVPGAIAAGALLVLIVPPFLVNMAAWWEVAAILLGIVLIGMELFVIPGFGVCGVLGVVLLFGGLIGTFVADSSGLFPGSPRGREGLITGVLTMVISGVTSGGIIYLIAKHLPSTPLLGRLVLKESVGGGTPTLLEAMAIESGSVRAGDLGQAVTPLRPAGRVQVGDRVVDAVAEFGFIDSGTAVRVVSASAFRVAVEPVESGPGAPGPGEGSV